MNNPVLNAIADRRSIRSYKDEKVTREQIDILLKAALEAPSAKNAQPWHFYVVQNRSIFAEINKEVEKIPEGIPGIFFTAPVPLFL